MRIVPTGVDAGLIDVALRDRGWRKILFGFALEREAPAGMLSVGVKQIGNIQNSSFGISKEGSGRTQKMSGAGPGCECGGIS